LKPNETLSLLGLLHTDDLHGHETENEWIELLLHRLAEQPLQATAIKSVVITAQCYSLGVCDNSTEEVLSVIDAILKNHGLSGRNRRAAERAADIVRSVAKVGDIPRRLPDLIDLVSAHPNEPFFLFLHANELRRQGRFEAARTIAAPLWGLAHSDILLSEPLRILRSRLIAEDSSSLVGRE
jgi:hypothetical protein